MMAEGATRAEFQKPPYDPVPPPQVLRGYGEAPEAEAPGGIGGGLGFLDTPAGGGRAAPARTAAARGQNRVAATSRATRAAGLPTTDPPRPDERPSVSSGPPLPL